MSLRGMTDANEGPVTLRDATAWSHASRVVFAVVALVAACPGGMQAQSEPAACQAATATRATRATARANAADQNALWALRRCPSSGPPALVSLWARQDLEPRTTATLVEVSSSLRDARILEAVVHAASETNRPVTSRLAALQVLIRYHDPRHAPSVEDLRGMPIGSPISFRADGAQPVDGASPLPADIRARVGAVLANLVDTEQETEIRRAALFLRQALAFEDPANTPLPPNTLTLVAGCGTRVRLRSTGDVSLPVRITVAGSDFDHSFGIRAGSPAKPTELPLSLPAGTVVASYGGREVARLSERSAACPSGMVH